MRGLARFVATAAYTGYAPVAPGTVGSLVGLILLAAVRQIDTLWLEPAVLVVVIMVGTWAADHVEADEGREDPGIVVVDEVAGMLLTMLFLPLTWWAGIVGFLAFRGFDIVKPFPAGRAERLPGGIGVMTDDLVAGVYAAIVVRLSLWGLALWF
jgi:phosphatidylglycerophosphatase A